MHTYTSMAGGADLYHFDTVSGDGGIIKNGSGHLILAEFGDANSYTGGTVINAGTVLIRASTSLGTGCVVFNSGTLDTAYTDPVNNPTINLENDFKLGANVQFGPDKSNNESALNLAGSISGANGVSLVNIHVPGTNPLHLSGNIADGNVATTFQFTGAPGSGSFILSGANSYTGGTIITGSRVEFMSVSSIPYIGTIQSDASGYAGLADSSDATALLARLDLANFHGTLGFDSPDARFPQQFVGDINLTGLSADASIGTTSSAILTGAITPRAAPPYSRISAGAGGSICRMPLTAARRSACTAKAACTWPRSPAPSPRWCWCSAARPKTTTPAARMPTAAASSSTPPAPCRPPVHSTSPRTPTSATRSPPGSPRGIFSPSSAATVRPASSALIPTLSSTTRATAARSSATST